MWILLVIVGLVIVIFIVSGNKSNSVKSTYSYQKDIQTAVSPFRSLFPNFYNFIERDKHISNAILHIENANKIEFKMPVMFFGNIVGYNHLGIEKTGNNYCMCSNSYSKRGYTIRGKRIYLESDLPYEGYRNNLQECFASLMADENYLSMSMGQM